MLAEAPQICFTGVSVRSNPSYSHAQQPPRVVSRRIRYSLAGGHGSYVLRGNRENRRYLHIFDSRSKHAADCEQAYLKSRYFGYGLTDQEKERLLEKWQAELDIKSIRSTEAYKLVCKFKGDAYTPCQPLQEYCLKRIADPSFPEELRTLVFEATMKLHVPYVKTDQSISLTKVASQAFGKWPENIGDDAQRLLKLSSTRAVLTQSLIIIPANFTLQFSLITPSAVQGSGHLIRYLALDLHVAPRDGTCHKELNRGSQSMASLKQLFPKLESCVFMTHLDHDLGRGRGSSLMTDRHGQPSSVTASLDFRNVKNGGKVITLEESFIEFIGALCEQGPGKRKFIRFSHSDIHKPSTKMVGPLVRVNSKDKGTSSDLLPMQLLADEEDHAERVFQKAYWGETGPTLDWWLSFREQWVYSSSCKLCREGWFHEVCGTS